MRIIRTIPSLRKALVSLRRQGKTVGFVPTMGYLHEGHLSLVRRARKENDVCVVSIYVNPAQFAAHEDLASYPRDLKRDSSMIVKENVDILFVPSNNDIYPNGYLTYIDVKKISDPLCGHFRPGHFRGVATIVAKLLNMVQPDCLYLGQKDAQQVAVLKAMVRDLDFPVRVKTVVTRREADGLAMSSRNKYLSLQERREAVVLYEGLKQAKILIQAGERSPGCIKQMIRSVITRKSRGKIQYVECVNKDTLEVLKVLKGQVLIALAVFFGKTRLIDNIIIPVHDSRKSKG